VIRVDDVTKTYSTADGEIVRALHEVTFDVRDNEFVSIVGPSGCGKSTLLRLTAGLVTPSVGSIQIDGTLVTEPFPDVGFVFQTPVLLPWRTVEDNVLFSIEMLGGNKESYRERTWELLALAGIGNFKDKYPSELSGGMQQRVAICRALVHNPKLLLMDEPFGALDALTREEMAIALLKIWDDSRKTILFVTHSISESIFLSDRVVVMTSRPGQIARIIDVDLPRPREPRMELELNFKRYVEEVRDLIYASRGEALNGAAH
jgi:NitT/TauT family transport system ATP-binding protein